MSMNLMGCLCLFSSFSMCLSPSFSLCSIYMLKQDACFLCGRNLREARDMAVAERERIQMSERELSTKYEQLLTQ